MTALVVALLTSGALEVRAPPGCVDPLEVATALDQIGGIDVAEVVRVQVTPRLDEYALVVDIALAQAEPQHREVPLRPRECGDVADLVAVLVQNQRRAALQARLAAAPESDVAGEEGASSPTAAPSATDPSTQGSADPGTATTPHDRSPCDVPGKCADFRLGLALGGSYPLGGRGGVDLASDLTPDVTAIAVAEAYGGIESRMGVAAGMAWRTHVADVAEVSLRGLLGAGVGTTTVAAQGLEHVECVPDASDNGAPRLKPRTGTTVDTRWYVAPTVAVRGRVGFVLAEAGVTWHLNVDVTPAVYLSIGVALFGS